nr:MAG TPA: hypothetical protein [Bacteriophage sp.]
MPYTFPVRTKNNLQKSARATSLPYIKRNLPWLFSKLFSKNIPSDRKNNPWMRLGR